MNKWTLVAVLLMMLSHLTWLEMIAVRIRCLNPMVPVTHLTLITQNNCGILVSVRIVILCRMTKFELPSLQYQETNSGVWGLRPFDAAPESLDSFIQSPLSGTQPSHCSSPRSSGLLEALLYEAKFISKSENQSSDKATSSSISQGAITHCSSFKAHSTEIKGIDPTSISGNSTGSIFNGCSPADPIGTAMEEKMRASHVKSEVVNQSCILDEDRKENLSLLDCSKPDAILGSCWLEQSGSSVKQRGSITDAIFLGDDLGSELKNMSSGNSGWGLGSCTWNYMPSAYQMSDLQ